MAGKHPGRHDLAFRTKALAAYVACGTVAGAAREVGMDRNRLAAWLREDWAQEMLPTIRRELTGAMIDHVRALGALALRQLEERLTKGDPYVAKDGTVTLKPMSGRDVAVCHGILADKIAVWSSLAQEDRAASPVTPESMKETQDYLALLMQVYARKVAEKQAGENSDDGKVRH